MTTALQEIFARFVTQFDDRALVQGARSTGTLTDRLKAFGVVLSGAAIVGGLALLVRGVSELGQELSLNASRLGVNTDQLQALGLAAADAGQEMDTMVDAVSSLQERLRDAVLDPQSDPAVQLRALGIAIPRSVEDMPDAITLIEQAADGLAGMSNQTDRVGIAMTLFGDVGRELLPVLQQGGDAIRRYDQELQELGGGLDAETIEGFAELNRQSARTELAFVAIQGKIALFLLPAITTVTNAVIALASGFNRMADQGRIVEVTMVALGVAGAAAGTKTALAWIRAALPFILLAVIIVALILVVEDLVVAFEGGESAIGDLSDEVLDFSNAHFGDDSAMGAVVRVWEFFAALVNSVATAVAGIFGVELPDRVSLSRVREQGDAFIGADTETELEVANAFLARQRDRRNVVANALVPADFERQQALASARQFLGQQQEGATVTGLQLSQIGTGRSLQEVSNDITITVNEATSGQGVEAAVERAMDQANRETVDALGQSAE